MNIPTVHRQSLPSCMVKDEKKRFLSDDKDPREQNLVRCKETCELRGLCKFTKWMEQVETPHERGD